ncbi:MAG: oligopeptide transporter, OPT family [Myxococcales bacterium]|nr:oligopeptide transporter, OPT family [Myxococcales bacterium]MCB9707410.1 oligopeptide transporter, OPT family [Myxococcales bacterium]
MKEKELTLRAVLVGLVLSMIMGAANAYLGLRIGMTVSASIPAAVIGSLLLRMVFRNGTILEANQIQTAASAGESIAAGVIFTLPALVLIGAWRHFIWWQTTLIGIAGGVLGVLMMVPMRKVFIVESTTLPYPEGVACAAVLKSAHRERGSSTMGSAKGVVWGTMLGATYKLLGAYFGLIAGHIETATVAFGRIFYIGCDVSPALLGVGFIVRWQIATLVFLGGVIGWLLGVPMLSAYAPHALSPLEQAWWIWDHHVRYLGVGAMMVAGITSVVKVRYGLKSAFVHMRQSLRRRPGTSPTREEDLSGRSMLVIASVISVIIAMLYYHFTQSYLITAIATTLMLGMAFFFAAVASYIVGLVGSSNSPVSGMTITAVLISGLLISLLSKFTGIAGLRAMSATLGIAAIICCVACTSGDVCNDLKTGHLIGASPRLQQIIQIGGIIAAAVWMAPVLELLHNNTRGGIGGRELAAPQATLFANLARGFFGDGYLPWHMVMLGACGATVIAVADFILEKRSNPFRLHLMPIAVGIYLPFKVTVPMLAGALVALSMERPSSHAERALERGVLFSSGLIAGEALMGIAAAALVAFHVPSLTAFSEGSILYTLATLVAAVIAVVMLFRHARGGV